MMHVHEGDSRFYCCWHSSATRQENLTQVHVVHVLLSIFEKVDHVLDIFWREDVEGHHKYKVPGLADLPMGLVDRVAEEQKVETDDRRDDLISGFSKFSFEDLGLVVAGWSLQVGRCRVGHEHPERSTG
jgi:hypothetical protein